MIPTEHHRPLHSTRAKPASRGMGLGRSDSGQKTWTHGAPNRHRTTGTWWVNGLGKRFGRGTTARPARGLCCWLPAVLGGWLLGLSVAASAQAAEDWPQWGRSPARNSVSPAKGLPVHWDAGQFDRKTGQWSGASPEIRWVARLGTHCYCTPVVSGGKVFCGTNNAAAYLSRFPASVDLGCLLAFDASSGRFLWQHSVPKLSAGKNLDWPEVGICSSALIENDRLWIVTNRAEVVCLDTSGFADGENDGPFRSESATGPGDADLVWSFDMIAQLGTVPRYQACCSVTAAGDLLLVGTSNGRDSRGKVPAPNAPSFVALDKHTGELIWADASPGENILDGQWASPAFAVLGGVPQAIFAGGDGWVYSFEARPTRDKKPRLLWKFDCNPKLSVWEGSGAGDRNTIVSTPVIYEGKVYVATGQDPEAGEGPADLWCLDPTRRGDTSAELVVDRTGKPARHRWRRAADPDAGEQVLPNPNSAAVWHYRGTSSPTPGTHATASNDFQNVFHRTLGMPAIHDGVLVIGDFAGLVHCLDAKTGRVHWTYDAMAEIWGSPLIADGKVYLATQEGDILVFQFGTQCNRLAKNPMGDSVYTTPVVAGRTLYVATASHLFAIETPSPGK